MDKQEAVKTLITLETKQGEHNGRWEDGYNIKYSTAIYYNDITQIADELDIPYAKLKDLDKELIDIKNNDCDYPLDMWTFLLKEKIEEYLIKIILN